MLSSLVTINCGAVVATGASAHEFRIDAETYQVPAGGQLVANLDNGQNSEGTTPSCIPRNFSRFDMVRGDTIRPVAARMTERPALNVPAPMDGPVAVVHETAPYFVNRKERKKIKALGGHKDFPDIATRHVKALIGAGSGAGNDRAVGLKTELVAITNRCTPDFDGRMRVQVLFHGQPRGDRQVGVFERPPSGEVEVTLHRTDDKGIATIAVKPGHAHLCDAVKLEPILKDNSATWDTFRAALTFAVPARKAVSLPLPPARARGRQTS